VPYRVGAEGTHIISKVLVCWRASVVSQLGRVDEATVVSAEFCEHRKRLVQYATEVVFLTESCTLAVYPDPCCLIHVRWLSIGGLFLGLDNIETQHIGLWAPLPVLRQITVILRASLLTSGLCKSFTETEPIFWLEIAELILVWRTDSSLISVAL